ncbi:MAG: CYTH domain-containing protein [Firmicutes bacterium]|nr:CYTH domain-containing protein [Bacillota bacterium]
MEVELKYAIADNETANSIWKDPYLKEIEEPDTRETVSMKGVYFDTEDHDFMKNDIALRVRKEGSRLVAALKWNDASEGVFHRREEMNVAVTDEAQLEKPNLVVFEDSDIGKELIKLAGGKKLIKLMVVDVVRRRFRVEENNTLMEISIDKGEIITENGNEPILEVEIELFSGDDSALLDL